MRNSLRRIIVLATVSLSLITVTASVAGVTMALLEIQKATGATMSQLTWILDMYTVVFAGSLMLGGAVGDKYGRRKLMAGGLLIYGLANGFAMVFTEPNEIILARAVAGLAAACIMPATLSIITTSFPEEQRATAVSLWVGLATAGAVVGVISSALIMMVLPWNSIFLPHLVMAELALVFTLIFIPESREEDAPPVDWIGGVLVGAAIAFIVFAIIEGPVKGWTDPHILVAAGVGIFLMVEFVWFEFRVQHPLIDPRLFLIPNFTFASISITIQFFIILGVLFAVAQYGLFVVELSELNLAFQLFPLAIMVMITAYYAVRLRTWMVERDYHPTLLEAVGLVVMGIGVFLLSKQEVEFNQIVMTSAMALMGIGSGLAGTPATTSIMSALPEEKQGVASAVNDTTREFGSAAGIAVVGSVVATIYKTDIAAANEGLPEEIIEQIQLSIAFTQYEVPADWMELFEPIRQSGFTSYVSGLQSAMVTASLVTWCGAALLASFALWSMWRGRVAEADQIGDRAAVLAAEHERAYQARQAARLRESVATHMPAQVMAAYQNTAPSHPIYRGDGTLMFDPSALSPEAPAAKSVAPAAAPAPAPSAPTAKAAPVAEQAPTVQSLPSAPVSPSAPAAPAEQSNQGGVWNPVGGLPTPAPEFSTPQADAASPSQANSELFHEVVREEVTRHETVYRHLDPTDQAVYTRTVWDEVHHTASIRIPVGQDVTEVDFDAATSAVSHRQGDTGVQWGNALSATAEGRAAPRRARGAARDARNAQFSENRNAAASGQGEPSAASTLQTDSLVNSRPEPAKQHVAE